MERIQVGVLFGGKSAEHEVSIVSASSIIKNLNSQKYDITPIYIDVHGKWHYLELIAVQDLSNVVREVRMIKGRILENKCDIAISSNIGNPDKRLDVIFPIIHGTLGEDGAVQGVFELLNIPYVGSNVLSSAITMDKEITKKLLQQHGISMTPFISIKEHEYTPSNQDEIIKRIFSGVSFPMFVKPANCGSSIGINKVKNEAELKGAISDAFKYDQKILVEQGVAAREIEVSVLENIEDYSTPIVSHPAELIPNDEFYSYKAKYIMENGARFEIPANLPASTADLIRKTAGEVFKILECNCLARVDFFLEQGTDRVFFNEINTLPGFTEISLYPKLLGHYGIGYSKLLDMLIDLAQNKHKTRQNKITNSVEILSTIQQLK
ncbi:D-alanine--D-alanine ligase family protein [Candidatus Bandiella euplotis]|uniref:D-alanine--D-alanine ligase n=1 Tax=Candidatus Bandiella euplotis TaxID=1664265 RepID=A0ABZ0USQ3_9RICK|nr:D-alanine--D-alanine ligase family protein [Candidatus Bandiella woodruffii]WPX97085.1 D-alanine--D-alanine ligase A [Candidatus Bandiella woodruffii]